MDKLSIILTIIFVAIFIAYIGVILYAFFKYGTKSMSDIPLWVLILFFKK